MDKALFRYAKDSIALIGAWDGASSVSAADTVTETGDYGVGELSDRAGDTGQHVAQAGPAVPRVAEDMQSANDGVRTAVEALMGGEGIGDEDYALWSAGGSGHGDQLKGQGTLERGEAEVAAMVVAEDEADNSVAEGADAVVKEDRATFDLGSFRFSHVVVAADSYTK